MKAHHFFGLAVLVIVGYILGVKFPAIGMSTLSKVGL